MKMLPWIPSSVVTRADPSAFIPGLLLAACLLGLPACAPDAKVAGDADSAGTYTLASVGGKPLPASIDHAGAALEVRSGTFAIRGDGTCGSRTVFVPPNGREVTREATATYVRAGSELRMKWKGAGMTTGVVSDDGFTMTNEGLAFVYRRQASAGPGDPQARP